MSRAVSGSAVPGIAIRDVATTDMPGLEQLMLTSFEPHLGEAWSATDLTATLGLPGVKARLAMASDQPCGFTLTYHLPDEAELLMVAVAPAWRRQGIARAMMQDCATNAQAAGLTALFLEVRDSNDAARSLYDSLGFVLIGRRKAYYRGKDNQLRDAVSLRLPLTPGTV
jgi:[ribosomal protein S18]-alanine N-acetyltransferase